MLVVHSNKDKYRVHELFSANVESLDCNPDAAYACQCNHRLQAQRFTQLCRTMK